MSFVRTSLLLIAAFTAACSTQAHPPAKPSGNWCQTAIAQLTVAQRALYEKDKAQGIDDSWMLTRPGGPASEADIQAAETRLGTHFDEQYKQWLRHANGWESFSGSDDLFSLGQVARDSIEARNMQVFIQSAEFTPQQLGITSFDQLIVVGGSLSGNAYFIAVQEAPDSNTSSMPVYTFSSGDFTRYDNFKTFIQKEVEALEEQ
ncbi:SMI1/KNR4 family protein [Nocardia miyunensis]|uniref:SMI1/KNR4 family protein n=1 Tax=Nocardia miyunensis TaxID=282684 RepID=UPI000AD619E9|nr:SMI1/KNR4 family protein [Nocardia miyunensis]